ncbi:hypothetical protein D3C75_1356840 [compost metagenome]
MPSTKKSLNGTKTTIVYTSDGVLQKVTLDPVPTGESGEYSADKVLSAEPAASPTPAPTN